MVSFYKIYGCVLASEFQFKTQLPIGNAPADLTFVLAQSPLPYSDWQSLDPQVQLSGVNLYCCKTYDVLNVVDVVNFYIFDNKIIAHLLDPQYDYQIEVLFMGLVFSYWLEKHDICAFHASAVNVDGNAIAFLSTNAGGKSSLAATLTQLGHTFITDDILPVRYTNEQYIASPSFPQMRMWPQIAEHFVGDYEHLPLAHPAYDKRRVPVDLLGKFYTESVPLQAIYLPERVEDETVRISIEQVSQGQAMMDLLANSFAIHILEYDAMRSKRFRRLSHLVRVIPIYKLSYPSGMKLLSSVCESILKHVKN